MVLEEQSSVRTALAEKPLAVVVVLKQNFRRFH
jgi:hypothetical protein